MSLQITMARSNAADRSRVEAPINRILEQLSSKHGFEVKGLSTIEGDASLDPTGDLSEQIKDLLSDYNYILLRKPDGKIERLIISGRKRAIPPPLPWGTVFTRRRGGHHIVDAVIRGPNGLALKTSMMIDTGATLIVLPESMMTKLGFSRDRLRRSRMRTANRTVDGYIGTLESVEIGQLLTKSVGVAFVEDNRLQGARLLGMSFLRRFRVTIDDEKNQITLFRNE